MKCKRFAEEQIIRILKATEAAGNIRLVCAEYNITEQTLYRWIGAEYLGEAHDRSR